MRILVVEDEKLLCDGIAEDLELEKYTVERCYDGAEAYDLLLSESFDLLILDLNLPGMDGLDLLRAVRAEQPELRVLILSARAQMRDKVLGLDSGADDYITKPFGVMELISRVKAVIRRSDRSKGSAGEVLKIGELVLDEQKHEVYARGQEVSLTFKEFELLSYLMKNRGLVLSRDKILNTIWNYEYEGESRTVDVHIGSLRQKLGTCGDFIKTIRGIGYKIED